MRGNIFRKTFALVLSIVLAAGGLILPLPQTAYAGSAGPTNCGTGADNSSVGTSAWGTPTNACGTGSTNNSIASSGIGHYLVATNFGFSIPANAVIKGIQVTLSRTGTVSKGKHAVDNAVRIVKGGAIGTTDHSNANNWDTDTAPTYGATNDLWGLTWTPSDINASNFGFAISPKSSGAAAVTATINAHITITITYNVPPNAPSQDSPANSATGISTIPTFLMTATDPDSDNLGYKVTVYSDNTCTTVVQTDDQAVSATGWTGTNGTCTAAPTACYLSSTQGSFLAQTALSGNTQYWWRASAQDPDGTGTFTDSSTCNTFTTAAAVSAPTITTDFAGAIDFQSANLVGSITATGGANATQNGFAYGTDPTLATVIATTTLGGMTGTGPFNGTIGGLSPSLTYYYRAYATNTGGTGYGSILNFITGDSIPSRIMRLFEGFIIKLFTGKIILFGS